MTAFDDTDTNVMRLLDGLVAPLLDPLHALSGGAHVVQLACGTGGLSLALARRRPDLRITAVDLDPTVLSAGRDRAAAEGLAIEFREMDIAALDFGDGTAESEARAAMTDDLSGHRTASGGYLLPATCRLITALGSEEAGTRLKS